MKFGLNEHTIGLLNQIFSEYNKIDKVILYGSRAKGNFKNGSDIDLTIVGEVNFDILLKIDHKIEELLLPYKIDISLFKQIENSELIEHINRKGKIFYQRRVLP